MGLSKSPDVFNVNFDLKFLCMLAYISKYPLKSIFGHKSVSEGWLDLKFYQVGIEIQSEFTSVDPVKG